MSTQDFGRPKKSTFDEYQRIHDDAGRMNTTDSRSSNPEEKKHMYSMSGDYYNRSVTWNAAQSAYFSGGHRRSSSKHLIRKPTRSWTLVRRNTWAHTALLMLADCIGTGVLSLPSTFVKLGWVPGIVLLVISCFMGIYSGQLLTEMVTCHPEVCTYGGLADAINIGERKSNWLFVMVYCYIFAVMSEYMVVLTKAVQAIFWHTKICFSTAGFIAMGCLLTLNQVRTLHEVSFLSFMSMVTIMFVLVVILHQMADKPKDYPGHKYVNDELDIWEFFGAFSSIFFAFAGHEVYIEMMYEMRKPEDFSKALWISYPYMLVVYLTVACIAYFYWGEHCPSYILDVLDYDDMRTITNVALMLHMLVSYVLKQQIFNRWLFEFMWPHIDLNIHWLQPGSFGVMFRWFFLTTCSMCVCFLVANMIPFFDVFVEFLGSLFVSWFALGIPVLMYKHFLTEETVPHSNITKFLIWLCIGVACAIMIFGTGAVVEDFTDASSDGIFACQCSTKQCQGGSGR